MKVLDDRTEYTANDVRNDIEWVMDAGPEDLTDLDIIARLATWISDPKLSDTTKAMVCLDLARTYTLDAIEQPELVNTVQALVIEIVNELVEPENIESSEAVWEESGMRNAYHWILADLQDGLINSGASLPEPLAAMLGTEYRLNRVGRFNGEMTAVVSRRTSQHRETNVLGEGPTIDAAIRAAVEAAQGEAQ